mmetsp:Transcript_61975/g.107885  ORF Transcript_61975/g.107885 Transcript_61975/m.107885 type:complete len:166 (-) Transcript_61975:154-651(-)
MADEGETFESGDSGASHTYPQQAGELRKGSHIMIKGKPCKVAEVTTSKTGKHGHAKAHIVALDIFTSKKYEDLCPTSHNVDVPFVKRTEMQCLSADPESGEVSLLFNDEPKDDMNLPKFVKEGSPTDDDVKISDELVKAMEDGKTVFAYVLEACGTQKIVGFKTD